MGKCQSKNKRKIAIVHEDLLDKNVVIQLQKGKIKMDGFRENNKLSIIDPPIIIDTKIPFSLDLKHTETQETREYSEKYFVCRRSFIQKNENNIVKIGYFWECCGSRNENHNPMEFHKNEILFSLKHPLKSKYK